MERINCKNCQSELQSVDKYCNSCGAKVVNERITVKSLISGLLVSLGWDNQFFVTFRDLVLRPQLVFEKYLNGTRKRYTNPFSFFAIGAALSVFILNFYSDELVNISTDASLMPSEKVMDSYQTDDSYNAEKSSEKLARIEKQHSSHEKLFNFMFKYYYSLSFLLLPFYALIAMLIFGKPDNYGEHLVINAYINGLLFFIGLLLFFCSLFLQRELYTNGSLIITMVYYLYAYKKYRKYSIGKTLIKLLKFIGIMFALLIIISVIGYFIGRFS